MGMPLRLHPQQHIMGTRERSSQETSRKASVIQRSLCNVGVWTAFVPGDPRAAFWKKRKRKSKKLNLQQLHGCLGTCWLSIVCQTALNHSVNTGESGALSLIKAAFG